MEGKVRAPIFQQDNAPAHTSRITTAYLDSTNLRLLEWPPQSPDLSPIENAWAIL